MKKWLGRLAKIGFFLAAFIGVVVTVLFNMGGDNETLKGAIEDYISATSGYAARIRTFNKMTFFPNISLSMNDIALVKPNMNAMQKWAENEAQKPDNERGFTPPPIEFNYPDGKIEHFQVSVGFWDAAFGGAQKIKNLQIRNAEFNGGAIHHKPLNIERLGIDETADGKAFIGLKGNLGEDEFSGGLDIKAVGSQKKPKYKLGEEGAFDFTIGKLEISGIMRPRSLGGMHLRDVRVIHNKEEIVNATFSFIREAAGNIKMKGEFEAIEFGSNGTFDWNILADKNMQIVGDIEATLINTADFSEGSRIHNALNEWDRIFKNPDIKSDNDKKAPIHNISVKADALKATSKTTADFVGGATFDNNQLLFQ
ncbi:MAG: hypothetical protein AB8B83_05710 [Bdellovibrionales bacterium]